MLETIAFFQMVLYVLGFGGLVYWMKRQIDALKGTVDAQGKIIEAQSKTLNGFKGLLESMGTVLESTDVPKMLERMKAYKEMVELEKEETFKQRNRQFEEEKRRMSQAQADAVKGVLTATGQVIGSLTGLIANLMPYIPVQCRNELIDSANLSSELKQVFHRLADAAPDLSTGKLLLTDVLRESLLQKGEQKPTSGPPLFSFTNITDPTPGSVLDVSAPKKPPES